MKKIFQIEKDSAKQRLDKFLTKHYPDYSRAYLQKAIKAGAVLVNKEIKKPSYLLKEKDKIEAVVLPPEKISLKPDPSIKFKIIYEDKNVIVIDKPAGLTVHPSATQKTGTLINGLLTRYPRLAEVGEDPTRPGLVHRLDKDTSGLMIIAKNNSAFDWLKKQFQERKVVKKYIALIVGRPKNASGEIKTFISRSKSDPTKQKVSASGKETITFYKTIKNFRHFTLIEAQPKTGRMHQIRVQLAWLGNPVAGDKKYESAKPAAKGAPQSAAKKIICPPNLKRQFLHAAQLAICLPNGQKKVFTSPLPSDLLAVLKLLKNL